MKVYLDANFFIFAAFDATPKGDSARAVLRDVALGKKQAITSILCLDEVMWAIAKNKQGERLRATIEEIYRIPNLKIVCGSPLVPLRALDFLEKHKMKPRDAMHLAFMQEENLTVIVSDDADFDKVPGIKRIF